MWRFFRVLASRRLMRTTRPKSLCTVLKRFACSVPTIAIPLRLAVTYSFTENQPPELPEHPIEFPASTLTHEFLIRQSCILSGESAARYLLHYWLECTWCVNRDNHHTRVRVCCCYVCIGCPIKFPGWGPIKNLF
jgi:hypothetical protein